MILFLAGTSDARELAVQIHKNGYQLVATVVTESAAENLRSANIPVRVGRLNFRQMRQLVEDDEIKLIIDASHPFAEEASKTAMEAADLEDIPYIRYERPDEIFSHALITEVDTYEDAALLAKKHRGVVMLTTGSKTLSTFTRHLQAEGIRFICRMLPNKENMEKCETLHIPQKDIIAIQGPFSTDLNKALYEQYGVTLMITKESGKVGAMDEKIEAAISLGIPVLLIKRPRITYINECTSFEQVNELIGGYLNGQYQF
ncbi:precorrin-6A/cobalt-precorrin-6A reductase [Bacillus ectoiniformans]|uniref:precorrin-6A reductase n=1 Tax=Bacillus ectoiniformans TaxID=1494429 RepID=UPI00195D3392|nr:precorrin-6A reductase [Bacillus ectoiniformans]MBM7647829.1 precorrin-6A/cobalt-precorrin-6A reductase [Bacillus ectoiniformans]